MTFDRIDSLILRRFPKHPDQWSQFTVHDGACVETLNFLVNSGCVERKAKVRWVQRRREVLGYAVFTGDWRWVVKNHEDVGLGLDPSEFKTTLLRPTELGQKLRPMLFDAESLLGQFKAIEFIKNMTAAGCIKLFHDDGLSAIASPHPFPIPASPVLADVAGYFDM